MTTFEITRAGGLFVRSIGTGKPIVFVHGWPFHGLSWRHVAQRLASRWRCHLVDLPGAGESGFDETTDFSAAGLARAARAAVDGLGLDEYTIVGFDFGGTLARLIAADDARVNGVILGNTEVAGHRPPWIGVFRALSRLPGSARVFRRLLASHAFRRSSLGYGGCFRDRALLDGEFHELFVKPLVESRRALAGALAPLRALDWSVIDRLDEVHRKIRAPVRLIWGADDRTFPVAHARELVGKFPSGAELVEIPGARLLVHEEKPAEFARETIRFLERLVNRGLNEPNSLAR